jgi:outer membrane beta-barrel protein
MIKQRYATFCRAISLGLIALSTPTSAFALQGGEDPALLPVLIDKRFGMEGRHQASLQFSTSMATKYVEALALYGAYQYNFTDVIGLEVGGGFFFGSEASIMKEVRAKSPGTEPDLSDLYQIQWMAQVDFVLTPVYGKMSFASEFDPAYDLFFVAGGGVAGLRRQVGAEEAGLPHLTSVAPAFNFGVGLHVYFTKLIGLRVEFRDYFYPDPIETADKGGLTFNLHFQVGLQFAFGGS